MGILRKILKPVIGPDMGVLYVYPRRTQITDDSGDFLTDDGDNYLTDDNDNLIIQ